MFFTLSKIFWILVTPLSFLWLLVITGFALRFWKRKWGNKVLLTAGALFFIIGLLPIGYNMLVYLETRFERPETMPKHVDGIIVLGGTFNSTLRDKTGKIAANGNVNRMIDFIDLANKYPRAQLIFTGGSGSLLQPERKEADDAKEFLQMMGFKQTNQVLFERKSRNTFENAKYSKELAKPKAGQTWILITSAFHMPRSMGIFEQQNWKVIPYPSGPRTYGEYRLKPNVFGLLGSFITLDMALREFIGISVYYFSGKSAFLVPPSPLESRDSNADTSPD